MKNPLSMSDEEFAGLNSPADVVNEEAPVVEVTAPTTETVPSTEDAPVIPAVEEVSAVEVPVKEEIIEPVVPTKKTTTQEKDKTATSIEQKPAATTSTEKPEVPAKEATVPPTEVKSDATIPDYKNFYERIMAPLKANGKTIELKTPEEAIQLMQMGANYTKKMQAITPYRKVLTMLENNALLDENKLSFLIDLDKKNPEAIKKLVAESGIDPLDLGRDSKTTYFEGNHRVSDEEVGFKTAVDDLKSNPDGIATLQEINAWDQASKEVLWKNPDLMDAIHKQRENGIYNQIQTEIERRRTLGMIPVSTPFINAYQIVGDELQAAGAFKPKSTVAVTPKPITPQSTAATPVVTRVETPKPAVVNNGKANAASSTRSTPRSAGDKRINPLAMSDDEFLKQMDNRV